MCTFRDTLRNVRIMSGTLGGGRRLAERTPQWYVLWDRLAGAACP